MTAAQPLDFSRSGSSSRTALDGLRHLFSSKLDSDQNDAATASEQMHSSVQSSSKADTAEITIPAQIEEMDAPQVVSVDAAVDPVEILERTAEESLTEKEQPEASSDEAMSSSPAEPAVVEAAVMDTAKVSKADLVNVLEGFVHLVKNSMPPAELQNPATISFEPPPVSRVTAISVDDKTAEVEELRCLLVEAQETIIRLLTERVEDRAKISALETELKLLPDLQSQADRALAVAMNTEDFRRELTKVKFELERVRLTRVRTELQKNRRSWWSGVRGWLFKSKNPPQSQA